MSSSITTLPLPVPTSASSRIRPCVGVLLFGLVCIMFVLGTVTIDSLHRAQEWRNGATGVSLHSQPSGDNSKGGGSGRASSKLSKADMLRRDVGLGLSNDSPEAEEAFFAGERERQRQSAAASNRRRRRSSEKYVSSSLSGSSPLIQSSAVTTGSSSGATCSINGAAGNRTYCPVRIDLVVYVLFQGGLNGNMFSGINWHWIPKLTHDMPGQRASGQHRGNVTGALATSVDTTLEDTVNASSQALEGDSTEDFTTPQPVPPKLEADEAAALVPRNAAGDRIVGDDTERIVQHMRSESQERDRTRIAFVAVNPHITKTFRLLPSQVSGSLRRRLYGGAQKARSALERELKAVNHNAYGGARRGGEASPLAHSGDAAPHPSMDYHLSSTFTVAAQLVPVKGSQLPKTVLAGRVLKEWQMPGYSTGLGFGGEDPHKHEAEEREAEHVGDRFDGAAEDVAGPTRDPQQQAAEHREWHATVEKRNAVLHHLEEFGTMRTLYRSGLTFLHTNTLLGMNTTTSGHNATGGAQRQLAADADGDGVQEWIGFFPNDVRIDLRLLQLIRRRIREGTARYLGRNVTTEYGGPPVGVPVGGGASEPSAALSSSMKAAGGGAKKKRAGAMFKGRVVGGAVVNSDSVNKPRSTLAPLPDAYSPRLALPANHHCCIFYSGSYPSVYLFNNALGQELLTLYNAFFRKNVTFAHLVRPGAPDAILESFVLPNALFNKVFPFVDHMIHRLVVDGALFPNPEIPPRSTNKEGGSGDDEAAVPQGVPLVASPTDVLERALAMALALEPRWLRIKLPVRHARDF